MYSRDELSAVALLIVPTEHGVDTDGPDVDTNVYFPIIEHDGRLRSLRNWCDSCSFHPSLSEYATLLLPLVIVASFVLAPVISWMIAQCSAQSIHGELRRAGRPTERSFAIRMMPVQARLTGNLSVNVESFLWLGRRKCEPDALHDLRSKNMTQHLESAVYDVRVRS